MEANGVDVSGTYSVVVLSDCWRWSVAASVLFGGVAMHLRAECAGSCGVVG